MSGRHVFAAKAAPAAVRPAPAVSGHAGRSLDAATRATMAACFNHDFSRVRTHGDPAAAAAARDLGAAAVTRGDDIAFAAGRDDPRSAAGRELLAHELAHVVQQAGGQGGRARGAAALEAEADRAATAAVRGLAVPPLSAAGDGVQCKVELRHVGRGEASGFERLPELVARLNAISTALIFRIDGDALRYTPNPYGDVTNFDTQMMHFIDAGTVFPLRMTNRHGRLGDRRHGFTSHVEFDAWDSGYVDIDDLLASSDTGLQIGLLHFLREREATPNYAARIGSPSLTAATPAVDRAFDRAHGQGIVAEVAFLQDFFGDRTIVHVPRGNHGAIIRDYTNSRRDSIRMRLTNRHGRTDSGVDAVSIEVVTRDGRVHTPEDYRDILAAARAAPAAAVPAP